MHRRTPLLVTAALGLLLLIPAAQAGKGSNNGAAGGAAAPGELTSLARAALARPVDATSVHRMEVNKSFPGAEQVVSSIRGAGLPYSDDDWFGPEDPGRWIVVIGDAVDASAVQAVLGALALTGTPFGTVLGHANEFGNDHRVYVGSIYDAHPYVRLGPTALAEALQPGQSLGRLHALLGRAEAVVAQADAVLARRVDASRVLRLEVNQSFPKGDQVIADLQRVGLTFGSNDWFGPENPGRWNLTIGTELPVPVAQAAIAAVVRVGVDFGVYFEPQSGDFEHNRRIYVGSLDRNEPHAPLDAATIQSMLNPSIGKAQLHALGAQK